MGASEIRLGEAALSRLVEDLLRAAGADPTSTAGTTRALIEASARGQDTHGVRLLPYYLRCLEGGRAKRAPTIRFTQTGPATGMVDADNGLGHAPSYLAVERASALARVAGIGAVAVTNSSHYGAAGVYALAAARDGLVAFSFTHADALVVPHGGRKPFLGTNPIAFACPVDGNQPLVLDMATSAIPFNRIFLRQAQGQSLPPEVATDAEGVPTTDPAAAKAVMPVGGAEFGYKGAGLAVMIDLLCAGLTGMVHGYKMPSFLQTDFTTPIPIGHFFLVIDPDRFDAPGGFAERAKALVEDMRDQPARPGMKVMPPGDPELGHAAERLRAGIPIDPVTWKAFADYAERFGVELPAAFAARAATTAKVAT